MADVTLVNLNMLYVRYVDRVEREIHLPLGPLYLARSLEQAGFEVDFRDYQLCKNFDLFTEESISDFLDDPAKTLFVSCMANLLPFTLLALKKFRSKHPTTFIALGGVGPAAVEKKILRLCPWIDAISIGEGERTAVTLAKAIKTSPKGNPKLSQVTGIAWRQGDKIKINPATPRIDPIDEIPFPAYHLVDLKNYRGINMMSSRGCPFPCTFCSVAPIWGRSPLLRSAKNIAQEMQFLHDQSGADLFLFQDEFFVSSPDRVQELCTAIKKLDFKAKWKAFGRIDLTDIPTMEAMAETGCIEIRYGVESGSAEILLRSAGQPDQ